MLVLYQTNTLKMAPGNKFDTHFYKYQARVCSTNDQKITSKNLMSVRHNYPLREIKNAVKGEIQVFNNTF